MQTRQVGCIIATALLVVGLTGCRNLPRGGFGRGPDVRTIAGIGLGPDRLAIRDGAPSTISSRVDPPGGGEEPSKVIGQVVDDRGVPVANARVRLAVDGTPGGREVVGTTNRSGQFLLKGLRPGEQYTLIAEWDDGREYLLGRSSVSSPSEEVRIEVASVEGSGRPVFASNAGAESSRAASFNRDDREPERISLLGDRPGDPPAAPRPDDRGSGRDRVGWIPFDSVNRTALEPTGPEEANAGGPRPLDAGRGIERPSGIGPAKVDPDIAPSSGESDPLRRRLEAIQEASDLDPNDFPLPMVGATGPGPDEPRPIGPGPREPQTRTPGPDAAPEPRAARPMAGGPPRATSDAVPPVRRFEPAMDRDREPLDPPLLMTDTPPETEDLRDDPAAEAPAAGPFGMQPGSMRLPDPAPRTTAPLEPDDRPTAIERPAPEEVAATPDESPIEAEPSLVTDGPEPDFPSPLEPEALPPIADGSDAGNVDGADATAGGLDPAGPGPGPGDLVEDERGDWPASVESGPVQPGNPEAMAAEEVPSFRWSDLPPPGPLDAGGPQGDGEGSTEEGESDAGGPGRWSRGLLKWVSREQDPADDGPAIEPAVRFDAERNRLEDFVLPDLNGRRFQLSEAESDYVLLCFWGTWCDPCVAAMPHLADLQRQFGPRRLRVVSIASQRNGEGGPRSLSRLSRRLGLNYPILLAPTDQPCPVAGAMGVQYFPTLILLDRDGNVVHRETGATGDKLMRLDRAIAAAMDESVMTVTKR
ncbi:redoxin domain-containing protein [Tautonia sp. JC769]|uniref:redoxin domain-containing protein n=1 Tax=Tautonia sp. JC769 TaxID=3232135 RepID=UPI00345909DF